MLLKLKLAYELVMILIWLLSNAPEFVKNVEERLPVSGKGAEKFAIVRKAIIKAASIAGFAKDIIDKVVESNAIDEEIQDAVDTHINPGK